MTLRLTLRTLLAYLNQANLNLRATERIEAKVRESQAAQQLIADLRRLTSDPSIAAFAADQVDGPRDPNQIAEYLDNALPDEQVEWFEKQCFESAVLLAEIATCHQLLSEICGGATAAASAAVRQRIYDLGRFNIDRARLPEQTEVRYLGGTPKANGGSAPQPEPAAQFPQPEAVFNLGPPPEERGRVEDWMVTLSGEDLAELRAAPDRRWSAWLWFGLAVLLALGAIAWGAWVWWLQPAPTAASPASAGLAMMAGSTASIALRGRLRP